MKRDCPNRTPGADRRQEQSLVRRWFGWLLTERRSGFDRRARSATLYDAKITRQEKQE